MGASGDLAKKKTYPALLELDEAKLLPNQTTFRGFARTKMSTEIFRQSIFANLKAKHADSFLKKCYYQPGASYRDWETMVKVLNDAAAENLLVYLAIPPYVFGETTLAVKKALEGLETPIPGFCRIVLEKPFGSNTESCKMLLNTLREQSWSEKDLYRIDHYLGKEMVRNILTLRQSNAWLSALWSKETVQSVHIIFKENFGTEGRGGYFDHYGIIRDILQNHLMQVLTLVAMELPHNATNNAIRDAKVKVLEKMPILSLDDCILGQYNGYKDDPTIENPQTVTPTYACVRTMINTPRWHHVPFVIEAGKALDERLCEIRLHFRGKLPNALVLRLQPTPAIFLTTNVKTPGYSDTPVSTYMKINYGQTPVPGAYARLLLDVLRGNQASFVRDDELLMAWNIFTPLLHEIEEHEVQPLPYEQGTNGPDARAEFLRAMGVTQAWLPPLSAL